MKTRTNKRRLTIESRIIKLAERLNKLMYAEIHNDMLESTGGIEVREFELIIKLAEEETIRTVKSTLSDIFNTEYDFNINWDNLYTDISKHLSNLYHERYLLTKYIVLEHKRTSRENNVAEEFMSWINDVTSDVSCIPKYFKSVMKRRYRRYINSGQNHYLILNLNVVDFNNNIFHKSIMETKYFVNLLN